VSDDPLMLSVSGLRGLVGRSLTPQVACRFAGAFGSWLKQQPGVSAEGPTVVLGRDSRASGQWVCDAVTAGLIATGCRVVRVGILTTPGVALAVTQGRADGGMMVTASHNPAPWNGIKPLTRLGVAPPPEQAKQVIARYHANQIDWVDHTGVHPVQHDDDAAQRHVDTVLQTIEPDKVKAAKLKVVLDSVHGAGGPEGRLLLEALGVERVHLFAEPTGDFPHTPEPTKDNLTGLCDAVKEHAADVGFAQDPDADRLAIVDDSGVYIGEEYTLALCVEHLLANCNASPTPPVAANLSTSRMINDIAERHGSRVIRTPVGEANVAEAIRAEQCLAGGEGNGGIIDPRVVGVRDSLVGMALVLEMLAERKQKLGEVVATIPSYALLKDKVPVDPELTARLAPVMSEAFAEQQVDTQDGVRIDWPDRWVHVRPSNTEPIIRLYAEASTEAAATDVMKQVRDALGLTADA